jgi:uncharacterized protein
MNELRRNDFAQSDAACIPKTCNNAECPILQASMQTTPFSIKKQSLLLSPLRTIFWQEQQALICSDLHLGKVGHFRKSGIAMPQNIFKDDVQKLFAAIQHFNPKQVIIVGDMVHSHANKELELFVKWRNDFAHVEFHLVKGNHDILLKTWYTESNIILHEQQLILDPFLFTHDPTESQAHYVISGHIHPGVIVKGLGKQALKFPCFYFGKQQCILPAFGGFTGAHPIEPKKAENVFAIVENSIIQIQ